MKGLQTMPLRFRVWDKIGKRFLSRRLPEALDIVYSIFELPLEIDCLDEDEKGQFIISQDTGLKDKNDNSIFVGDIVHVCYSAGGVGEAGGWVEVDCEITGVVMFDVWGGVNVVTADGEPHYLSDMTTSPEDDLEVLSSIWQSPELLEVSHGDS